MGKVSLKKSLGPHLIDVDLVTSKTFFRETFLKSRSIYPEISSFPHLFGTDIQHCFILGVSHSDISVAVEKQFDGFNIVLSYCHHEGSFLIFVTAVYLRVPEGKKSVEEDIENLTADAPLESDLRKITHFFKNFGIFRHSVIIQFLTLWTRPQKISTKSRLLSKGLCAVCFSASV